MKQFAELGNVDHRLDNPTPERHASPEPEQRPWLRGSEDGRTSNFKRTKFPVRGRNHLS